MSLPYIPKFGTDNNNREEENFVINNDKPPPQDESPVKQNQRNPEGQKFAFNNVELSDTESSTSSPMNDVGNEQEDATEAEFDVTATYSRSIVPTMKQNIKATAGVIDSNAPRASAGGANPGTLPPRHQKPNKKSLTSSAVSAKSISSAAAPTVLGSVIEPGQEATGRWTRDEHEAFLIGLKLYGKEWKKVAAQVRTRTVVQTRTHAQKYFQKLQKAYNSGEVDLAEISGLDANEIAIVAESLGTTINYKEPNKGHLGVSIKRSKKDPQQQPEKKCEGNVLITLPTLPGEDNEQLQQEAVKQMQEDVTQQEQKKSSPSSISLLQKPSTRFQQHEFSVPEQRPGDLGTDRFGALVTISSDNILSSDKSCKFINFTADQPKSFPPPSPAACGKRKLAELAVAEMLAGVISNTSTGSGHGMAIDAYEKGR
jgi:SHAQKYF class myb-like DNA-binding protein